ncbi:MULTISPECIES: AraC family transcriptional regulator [Prauserella]|uniref:Helix-turn-helix transcriptional regulator n=1 Tax=Prauserella endophytica TaxID=1592324 RepID=A0ABY2RZG3_9PSEU|nr:MULTISPECIES: AraC family transcriptional regulator [Prauserella]PXY24876.1 hypothetical protein BAY59_22715 [Prauserella coralliicola]TKG66630.1 helix-turn-helix transcriptional regulator [Prauserella endophytica]
MGAPAGQAIQQAIEIMERHPRAASGSLTGLAGAVGLTRPALHDAFREHCGMTPHQYLRRERFGEWPAQTLR